MGIWRNLGSRGSIFWACMGFVGIFLCIVWWNYQSDAARFITRKFLFLSASDYDEIDLVALEKSLSEVAFRNKTVIITTLNKSWAQNDTMIDAFLYSFHVGEGTLELLDHMLIVTLDRAAHDRCTQLHRHCFKLAPEGIDFSGEKVFMSSDYLKLMWRRVDFLRHVLQLGYNIVFTDADILWFRDPFPHFSTSADMEIACDRFNGNPTDISNDPNGGFLHVISNNRTIDFYKLWYDSRLEHPDHHDQDVFNDIKYSTSFREIGLRVRFLDTRFFGGFCQVSKDFNEVCTMHANCCTHLDRKLYDLKLVLEDWLRFKEMSLEERQINMPFWRAPRECLKSWKH